MTSHIDSNRRLWSFTVLARLLIALTAPCHLHWRRLMLFRTWCQNLVPVRHTRCFPSFLGISCLVSLVLFLLLVSGGGVGVQNLAGCGHHGAAGAEQITPMFVNWTDVPSLNCDFLNFNSQQNLRMTSQTFSNDLQAPLLFLLSRILQHSCVGQSSENRHRSPHNSAN